MRQILFFAFLLVIGQLSAQPYSVGHATYNFVDASRTGGTSISGAVTFPAGATGREIGTQVYYPATATGNNTPLAAGKFPVIVFGHGFAMTYDAYTTFFDSMARNGFIVALPTTEGSLIPSPVHLDFGKDLAFVAAQFLAMNTTTGNFFYNALTGREAIGGHSMGGGCTFLADAYANNNVVCYFTYAAAETTPSAIAAAAGITRPHLVFSGTDDCIAPTATNQTPMYDSLKSACKTHINITAASHCEFADYNATCSLGEVTCEAAGNLASAVEQVRVRLYLEPYLDYYLKGICPAWTKFENLIDTATIATITQICNNVVPQNALINGSHSFCFGTSAQLNATPAGFSYTWSNQDTGIAITANIVGSYVVTVSNGTCNLASSPFQLTELYPPALPTAITGADTFCAGASNLVFSTTADSIATFNWLLPSGWAITQGAGTNSITVTAGNTGGTIYVSALNTCDTTASVGKPVVIGGTAPAPGNIAGQTIICNIAPTSYSIIPVNGATGYQWSYPLGWSLQSGANTNLATFLPDFTSGYVTVMVSNSCGQHVTDSLKVSYQAQPQITPISGPDTVCSGISNIIFSSSSADSALVYNWILPAGWAVTSGAGTANINVVSGDTSGSIFVTAENFCASSTLQQKNVTVIPSNLGNVAAITGSTSVCQGAQITYSVLPVTGATSYSWLYPVGWSAISATDSPAITLTANNNPGYVIAAAINSCGQSLPDTLSVTLQKLPIVTGLLSADTICLGQDPILIPVNALVTGTIDSGYWVLPANWVGVNVGDTSITINADTSGIIYYSAQNACGYSDTVSKTIVIGRSLIIQITQNGNTLLSPVSGQSYQWFLNGQPIAGANSQTYNAAQSGNYTVNVTGSGGCVSLSDTLPFVFNAVNTVYDLPVKIYPNPASACVNIDLPYAGVNMQIEDMEGRLVKEQRLDELHNTIALQKLSSGFYMINIINGNNATRQKLVVY